jgi:hypothetical protein
MLSRRAVFACCHGVRPVGPSAMTNGATCPCALAPGQAGCSALAEDGCPAVTKQAARLAQHKLARDGHSRRDAAGRPLPASLEGPPRRASYRRQADPDAPPNPRPPDISSTPPNTALSPPGLPRAGGSVHAVCEPRAGSQSVAQVPSPQSCQMPVRLLPPACDLDSPCSVDDTRRRSGKWNIWSERWQGEFRRGFSASGGSAA